MMRAKGVKYLFIYLDDFLLKESTPAITNGDLKKCLFILNYLGLPEAKSKTERATTSLVHRGYLLDTKQASIAVKPKHKQWILRTINSLIDKAACKRRKFQSLCGVLSWASPLVHASRQFLASFWCALKSTPYKDVRISDDLRSDMRWWLAAITSSNGSAVFDRPKGIEIMAATDASGEIGYGAWVESEYFSRKWSETERQFQINVKELLPIRDLCRAVSNSVSSITVGSDSLGVVFAWASGSSKSSAIVSLLRDISTTIRAKNITLLLYWLPREYNVVADLLSKDLISSNPFPRLWSPSGEGSESFKGDVEIQSTASTIQRHSITTPCCEARIENDHRLHE